MGDQTVVEISLRTAADHFGRKLSRSVVRVVLRFAQLGTWRAAGFGGILTFCGLGRRFNR
jgi:hypothetical protein